MDIVEEFRRGKFCIDAANAQKEPLDALEEKLGMKWASGHHLSNLMHHFKYPCFLYGEPSRNVTFGTTPLLPVKTIQEVLNYKDISEINDNEFESLFEMSE